MSSDSPAYLTMDQVVAIHDRMITDHGGQPGVRDPGLLASAVMMPSASFEGEFLHSSIPSMAAAYLFHLVRNHSFHDGNKRTALAAAEVFLVLNDYRLEATDRDVVTLTEYVAAGSITKPALMKFFEQHATKA